MTVEATDGLEDILKYVSDGRNVNTTRKIRSGMQIFTTHLNTKHPAVDVTKLNTCPAVEMDRYLAGFLMELKKTNGDDYQPDTITSYQRSIGQGLREMGCPYDVVRDKEFKLTKEVLATKRKLLKRCGLGNRPNKARVLTDEQEEMLWTTGALGDSTPPTLQNTLWFLFAKLFGWRGRDESRQLRWGDVNLSSDELGMESITFNERATKTRTGQAGGPIREFVPTIWGNKNTARCPIRLFKKFDNLRPTAAKTPDFAFFLTARPDKFVAIPMGERYLGNRMSTIAKEAGLVGHFTNHSVRKTTITQLVHAGVHPTQVAQLSGHKNVSSINNYSAASVGQQKNMCSILQGNALSTSSSSSVTSLAGIFNGATFNAPVTVNITKQ